MSIHDRDYVRAKEFDYKKMEYVLQVGKRLKNSTFEYTKSGDLSLEITNNKSSDFEQDLSQSEILFLEAQRHRSNTKNVFIPDDCLRKSSSVYTDRSLEMHSFLEDNNQFKNKRFSYSNDKAYPTFLSSNNSSSNLDESIFFSFSTFKFFATIFLMIYFIYKITYFISTH
ncbi:hypothetical protein [Sulfuricurvum sp.]|uniref:hypothetical protein n=1 Tax=Sulfuricurvum sp. TaxID=2025608 RepID=UPI00260F1C94|nr:hypothetical protein [Sulfuricurvum sp.]MDD4949639.1 hypothetical protein [Sulfuricurvum sp.]